MNPISRRKFMAGGSMTAAAALLQPKTLHAAPPDAAIGLQLYSVRQVLAQDFPGTLAKVAGVGYRNVEAAGFYNHSAANVKQMMTTAGLKCVSAHYSLADLLKTADATMGYANALGLEYVICSSPSVADPARFAHYPGGAWQAMQHGLTADDWKWNAEQFNQMGGKMKAQGLKFGYHNHTMEFRDLGGTNGYQILLSDTDPSLVTLEMDCGWVVAGGADPVELLSKYPARFSMLHVKDLEAVQPGQEPGKRVSTELGHGVIDYKPIFAAARNAGIRYSIVEQEDFDMPVFDALKIDFEYMRTQGPG
ncbi:MAG TPA: sugar phosphate isomerase/epimerase [Silvibacterium sp.]|nr:sugar phosphate isomerase/epimerase [Silvibacterium sp.]